ncbi:transcription repressor OFP14-like [Henckelia pumila]|uniref:transcription repressor OFP14-like n=1 Tax=Henckelia pumila TaxID=405737 RepID=UPI003C6DECB8
MPKQLIKKSVRECLSKMKIQNKQIHFRFRSCRHTKTASLDAGGEPNEAKDAAVTLSDIDKFLYENFRSLYLEERDQAAKEAMLESPRLLLDPPGGFFVDEASSSSSSSTSSEIGTHGKAPEDFIVVFTHSPTPYDDFRRSMKEMVDARLEHSGKVVDWEFLEELLFCYLDLNNKKSYRHILHAFVDLIVLLRDNSSSTCIYVNK